MLSATDCRPPEFQICDPTGRVGRSVLRAVSMSSSGAGANNKPFQALCLKPNLQTAKADRHDAEVSMPRSWRWTWTRESAAQIAPALFEAAMVSAFASEQESGVMQCLSSRCVSCAILAD